MNTLGDALIISGPVAMLAAAIIYRFHLSRIIVHLKTNYHGIWSDLAGGNYSANPLIIERRLIPALKNACSMGYETLNSTAEFECTNSANMESGLD